MITPKRLNLNLASHPLRNRRLYILLLILLGGLFLLVSVNSGNIYWRYKARINELKVSRAEVDRIKRELQREEKRYSVQIDNANKNYKKKVDLINSFILRKSFSWVEFLTALENSLPDSSYIVSLTPSYQEAAKIEIRFKIATPNLNELFNFISHLESLEFKEIRAMREQKSSDGYLLTEISLIYERII